MSRECAARHPHDHNYHFSFDHPRPSLRALHDGMSSIHLPFFLDAAILSRMRSPVTSRSNWAKDKRTFSFSRPTLVVVLNCWVIDTNETPRRSKTSTSLAKSESARVSRSTL